ncbi:MAG TPA: helix-turn-helix domain-containing protein [Rudaea sp.]|nr:helix-turn-helix domain-containing protein [Rudaea sp.]
MIERIGFEAYVIDSLLPDLVGHDHKSAAFLVYLYLWRQTSGRRAQEARVSHQGIAVDTGLSKSTVQAAIRHLRRRGLIDGRQDHPTATPRYRVLKPWRR